METREEKRKILMSPKEFALIPKPSIEFYGEVIDGLVDPQHLSIQEVSDGLFAGIISHPAICYKDVPLWRTMIPLEAIRILVPIPFEEEDYKEPYMLVCQDVFGDLYTYGNWDTLEDMKRWLENPVALY